MKQLRKDKSAQKRELLVRRTAQALGTTEMQARHLLAIGRQQSLRINTLRTSPLSRVEAELEALGWSGTSYEWIQHGYTITDGLAAIRDSQLTATGKVYIQNAASWLPVLVLEPNAGELILDVCAAPGGKTSHIAAITNNQARIWANDNSRPRLAKMRANFERLGVEVEQLTLFDATQLARKLDSQQFDKILLDAPCSGEGMMRLDNDKDFTTWSVAQIKRLQQLQKRVISQAWQLLAPGGTLIYSTCTMAPEENEAVIDYLLRSQDDATIEPIELNLPNRVDTVREWNGKVFSPETGKCMRLVPSKHIEAFFVCKLKKVAIDN